MDLKNRLYWMIPFKIILMIKKFNRQISKNQSLSKTSQALKKFKIKNKTRLFQKMNKFLKNKIKKQTSPKKRTKIKIILIIDRLEILKCSERVVSLILRKVKNFTKIKIGNKTNILTIFQIYIQIIIIVQICYVNLKLQFFK